MHVYQEPYNVITFLHPASTGPNVDFHKALKRFGMRFLPREYVPPTVNLMRKWYRTKLMSLTTTEVYVTHRRTQWSRR